jgi:hypothetical protein
MFWIMGYMLEVKRYWNKPPWNLSDIALSSFLGTFRFNGSFSTIYNFDYITWTANPLSLFVYIAISKIYVI